MLRRLWKNLWVRLSLLGLLSTGGGYAIYASLPSRDDADDEQVEAADLAATGPTAVSPIADADSTGALSPADLAGNLLRGAGEAAVDRLPAPPAIVRANDDDHPPASAFLAPPPTQPRFAAIDDQAAPAAYTATDDDDGAPPRDLQADLPPWRRGPDPSGAANPYDGAPVAAPPVNPLAGQFALPTVGAAEPEDADEPPPQYSPAAGRYVPPTAFAEPSAPAEPADESEPIEPRPSVANNAFGDRATHRLTDDDDRPPPIAVPAGQDRYGPQPPPTREPLAGQGQGRPGDAAIEGPQTPSVTLQKSAPNEIQVGKPARFEIQVVNTGQVTAHQVVVLDEVPQGTRLLATVPEAERGPDGALMWRLGSLQPGEAAGISIELMPLAEGEIGSVATVSLQSQASVRTVSTRPQLMLEQEAPKRVLIGDPLTLAITLSNPGSGAATGVILEEFVPEGLVHTAGRELEYEVGVLRPGEARRLELTLVADKPGILENVIVARGDANLEVDHRIRIEVVAPQLELAMTGPRVRYLDRQATFTLAVRNPGTAPARDIELAAHLPRGMKFLAADHEGQYDPRTHAIYWSLAELPVDAVGQVQITTLPIEPGEQKVRVEGQGALGLSSHVEQVVQVEALAELVFSVADTADPIEVGNETSYQIRVVNQGSKAATGVNVVAVLPAELRPLAGDGPTRAQLQGQQVVFEPLARLAPREEAVFQVHVQGIKAGDQRIRVQVASNENPTPVAKEEVTRVYADQ